MDRCHWPGAGLVAHLHAGAPRLVAGSVARLSVELLVRLHAELERPSHYWRQAKRSAVERMLNEQNVARGQRLCVELRSDELARDVT